MQPQEEQISRGFVLSQTPLTFIQLPTISKLHFFEGTPGKGALSVKEIVFSKSSSLFKTSAHISVNASKSIMAAQMLASGRKAVTRYRSENIWLHTVTSI